MCVHSSPVPAQDNHSDSCVSFQKCLSLYSYLNICLSVRAQLCLTLCVPVDYSWPSSSVHVILQARTVAWLAGPSSRGSSQLRYRTHVSCVSCIAGRFFTHWATWEARVYLLSYFLTLLAHLYIHHDGPVVYHLMMNPRKRFPWYIENFLVLFFPF